MYNHKLLTALTKRQYKQIKNSVHHIEKITGTKVSFIRPPFGQYNETTMKILEEMVLIPVMWEISSFDWQYKMNPEMIIYNVVEHMKDGSIILLHELEQTRFVLPRLIDEIRNKGFEFSLLSKIKESDPDLHLK
ncbi:polysaccharide deacetylase family protein [Salibacterium salarium]|uniref:polysaccharide deacetylase family protein n=1 Tax=Salibacterium salarium TaxID=284579 RepID=UPI0027D7AEB8|nr:polysaccharide deacetylase family protein [Salibacterium salarium]